METALYKIGKEIGEVVTTAADARSADSAGGEKVTKMEMLKIGKEVIDVAIKAFTGREELVAAIADRNISDDERAEFAAGFKDGFVLPAGETEDKIEGYVNNGLLFIATLFNLFAPMKKAA